MSISINVSGLFRKSKNTITTVGDYQSTATSGNVLENKNIISNKATESNNINGSSSLEPIRWGHKKKMSPQLIARRIAQGKTVSREERDYLRQNYSEEYRKAVAANRIRENLEAALKSAQSDTAKATAVSEATALASTLASMDAKSEDSDTIVTGAELYSDAIQAALQKLGSKNLNKELKIFMQVAEGISEIVECENSSEIMNI